MQTDVTNIKTDVGTIETTVEQIAGQGGGSEPWENVTDVFIYSTSIGTGGFVANKDIYMLCVPTKFDIGNTDPEETYFWYYGRYGNCEVNGIAIGTTDGSDYHYPLPMGVKFKFKTNSSNTKNALQISNAIVFIYSK